MRHTFIIALGAAVLSAPAIAQPAARQKADTGVELSTGLDYQEGDYLAGQRVAKTEISSSVRVATGRLQFSAKLPYDRVDAPGNVVAGGGLFGLPIIVDPTRPGTRSRREGLGDLRLGAAYTVPSSAVGLTIASEVKIPTASAEQGLGTGQVDYAVGAELSKTIGRITPFFGVGYSLPGKPDGYALRNTASARAGAAVQLGKGVRGHVAYGYAQSASPAVPDEQQIATGLNASLSQTLSLGVYGSAGLSKGAPEMGAGLQLGFRIK